MSLNVQHSRSETSRTAAAKRSRQDNAYSSSIQQKDGDEDFKPTIKVTYGILVSLCIVEVYVNCNTVGKLLRNVHGVLCNAGPFRSAYV